jgi:glutathione peroxidase
MTSVHDFTVKTIQGQDKKLADYAGNVLLVVNVASKCGLTPQYNGLEALNEKYGSQGLKVLGFPANDFGAQEPGTEAEIETFCTTNYGVKFDMFAKVALKGEHTEPLYEFLQDNAENKGFGGAAKWNFTKFLVDKRGKVIARFEPQVEPTSPEVEKAIENALGLTAGR